MAFWKEELSEDDEDAFNIRCLIDDLEKEREQYKIIDKRLEAIETMLRDLWKLHFSASKIDVRQEM